MEMMSRQGGSGLLFKLLFFPFFLYMSFLPSCTIIDLFPIIISEQGVGNGNQSVGDTAFCHSCY